jgi:hypothetical protein
MVFLKIAIKKVKIMLTVGRILKFFSGFEIPIFLVEIYF